VCAISVWCYSSARSGSAQRCICDAAAGSLGMGRMLCLVCSCVNHFLHMSHAGTHVQGVRLNHIIEFIPIKLQMHTGPSEA